MEPVSEPPLTLDAVRRDMIHRAPNPVEECADFLGCCLGDVFADNHDVVTAEGALVDLGSFRAPAGFIANFRYRRTTQEGFGNRGDYIEFYMGTTMVRHRADLTPVYELIFRRMRQIGLNWRYVHPHLYAIEFSSLSDLGETDVPEALHYEPAESFWRERQLVERQTELAEFRQSLDEAYRASIQNACDGSAPPTVHAYQRVYERDPDGWPPTAEDQEGQHSDGERESDVRPIKNKDSPFSCARAADCIFCPIRLYVRSMNDAQVEEIKRYFGVATESLRSDIRQVAEGHSGIRREIQELREEFRDEFKEMRALMFDRKT